MESLVWPVILMLVGIGLVGLEIFVPSAGLLGVLAATSIIASIVMAYMHSMVAGTLFLLVATLAVPAIVMIAIKSWRHTPMGRVILIKRPDSADEVLPDTEEYQRRRRLVGKQGVAKTELLPSGDVIVEGRKYDAVSHGMVISAGQAVRVIAVDTLRLVVRPLGEAETAAAENAPSDVLATPIEKLGIEPLDDPLA